MSLVGAGIGRVAGWGRAAAALSAVTREVVTAGGYAARTFGSPAGLRGLALEGAWLAAHAALYPAGALHERLAPARQYRTDPLSPLRRSLVVTDVEAAGTPILLVHGIMDNRSVFTVLQRGLRRRGFGAVHAMNYSLFTDDLRTAAHQLRDHVERLRDETGADAVHIVGHSLGGVVARYYVQRMGGDAVVDTLVTLGSPHAGTLTAHLFPTPLARQLRPGSEPLAELDLRVSGCRTRFLVVWSRMDEMIVPQRNARLLHPDLDVTHLELRDVGHLAMPIDARVVHWVADSLARSGRNRTSGSGRWSAPDRSGTLRSGPAGVVTKGGTSADGFADIG